MNADLHMAGDLKAGGGNLFVAFGEPDIEIVGEGDKLRVRPLGVDIFRPATGEVSSSDPLRDRGERRGEPFRARSL